MGNDWDLTIQKTNEWIHSNPILFSIENHLRYRVIYITKKRFCENPEGFEGVVSADHGFWCCMHTEQYYQQSFVIPSTIPETTTGYHVYGSTIHDLIIRSFFVNFSWRLKFHIEARATGINVLDLKEFSESVIIKKKYLSFQTPSASP